MQRTSFKPKPCKCGGMHSSMQCPLKQRKPLKQLGKRGKKNRETSRKWRAQNTEFICYLRISPLCPVRLDEHTAIPEHVVPKSKSSQADAHDITKIRASCGFCNEVKGSKTIEKLSETYQHLKTLLLTI